MIENGCVTVYCPSCGAINVTVLEVSEEPLRWPLPPPPKYKCQACPQQFTIWTSTGENAQHWTRTE